MKYEIPTLLALSQKAHIDIEKFSIQALGSNLLRQRKASLGALSERPPNRSREVSNFSCRTEGTSSTLNTHLRYPSRQPNDPPQGTRAQTDAGFARFLKEHASPKHQRVTAGGRIVPMDSQPPVPKMKLSAHGHDTTDGEGVKPSTISQGKHKTRTEKKDTEIMDKNPSTSDTSKTSSLPSGTSTNHAKLPYSNGNCPIQAPGLYPALPPALVSPAVFMQPNNVPLAFSTRMFSQDQAQEFPTPFPNHVPCGFSTDQTAWVPNMNLVLSMQNPTATLLPASNQPHLSNSGSSSDFSTYSGFPGMTSPAFSTFSSGFESFYHAFPAAGQQFFDSQPSPNQPFLFPGTSHEAMQWKSLQDTTKEHETLSAQLSRLDRYMAMHSWDLDPQSKKSLVEQRMSLVRELDAVRLHKEQLELILGQLSPGTSDVHREGPVDIQMLPAQYLTGNVANSQNYIAPRPFLATANHAAPNLSTFTLADTLPSMLPTYESFDGGSPRQSKDDRNSSGTGSGFGPMPTKMKMNVPHETGPWYREQKMARGSNTSKQDAQVQAANPADAKSTVGNGDGWTTPTKSAPPDIRRIYRRIEETSKRGGSMEELLKELAAATTRLVQRSREERDGSPHPPLRQTDRSSLNSQLENDTILISRGSKDVGVHSQPVRLAARRLWKSENGHLQRPSNILGTTSFGTDEDDGKSCSSYESTADSWATIEEGDKRWVQREMLKGETDDEDESSSQNSAIESILEHSRMVESQTSNTRDTIDWVRKTKTDGEGTNKECDTSSFDHTKGAQAHSSSEVGKPTCSQLLTQYFNKERGIVSQKSAALTVSHNVNAHAYLPSFDGACDSPCRSEGSQVSESHLGHDFLQKDVSRNPNQENQWCIPKERIKPSPAVLREFFRRVEEEERKMVHQYQIMGSIPR